MMAVPLEEKSLYDICDYLEDKGFTGSVIESFQEHEMDGAAIAVGLASTPCADWLKEVIPNKTGLRLKVHGALKTLSLVGSTQPSTTTSSPVTPSNQQSFMRPDRTMPTCTALAESTPSSSRRIQANALPKPFPIPKFRQSTENNFENKILTDADRKYVVQTMSTILMAYTQKASMFHCSTVAKALVAKYNFLKDTEGDGEHSWKWFIYYRTQNINRPSKQEGITSNKAKRPRLEDRTAHLYPPLHGEDEVSFGRNLELLKSEMLKSKPRTDILKDLMCRTFANRWGAFVDHNEPATLLEYLSLYPLLKKTAYANIDFGLACKKDGMRDDFEAKFPLWSRAIITYCKFRRSDPQHFKWKRKTTLQTLMKSTPTKKTKPLNGSCFNSNSCAIMALRCLTLLFATTKTKKLGKSLPYVLHVVPRGTTPAEAAEKNNNQPHIVFFSDEDCDGDEMKQFFICVEGNLMLECSNIMAAIFFCVGTHYIFNLNYHPKSGDIWVLIQEKVLGIASKSGVKRHPSSASHFSGISRVYESLASNPASEE